MGSVDSIMVKRNFKKNPVTDEEVQQCRWYVAEDDLIGGWLIANVDKPASLINPYAGDFEISTFVKKTMAEHIIKLHNDWWDAVVWNSYQDNIAATALLEENKPLTEDEWFHYASGHEAT